MRVNALRDLLFVGLTGVNDCVSGEFVAVSLQRDIVLQECKN